MELFRVGILFIDEGHDFENVIFKKQQQVDFRDYKQIEISDRMVEQDNENFEKQKEEIIEKIFQVETVLLGKVDVVCHNTLLGLVVIKKHLVFDFKRVNKNKVVNKQNF